MPNKEDGQTSARRESDRKEYAQVTHEQLLWLVGILEVGGNVAITPMWRNGELIPAPRITVGMQPEKISAFQAIFGGSVLPVSGGHHTLYFRGEPVIKLIKAIEGDVVRLREWVEKSLEMDQAFKDGERFDVEAIRKANAFKDTELTVEDYRLLILQPAAVAGIIDNRGTIYNQTSSENTDRNNPTLQVNSTNEALLNALAAEYGGSVQQYVEEGQQFVVLGKDTQAQRDGFYWRFTSGGVRKYLPLWEPYLAQKPYEGWKSKLLETRILSNEEIAQKINQQMAVEIRKIEDEGSLTISTVEELMQQHGLLATQWPNFKQRYLDQKIYQKHAELRNSLLQRRTTESDILAISNYIRQLLDQWLINQDVVLPAKRNWREYFKEKLGLDISVGDTDLVHSKLGHEFYSEFSKIQQQQAQVISSSKRKSLLSQAQIESMEQNKVLAEEVNSFLAAEIEAFDNGEINRFSTLDEVTVRFNIARSSWHYFKDRYMDKELVAKHSRLRNIYNQKKNS
jgi:hypothetical protein